MSVIEENMDYMREIFIKAKGAVYVYFFVFGLLLFFSLLLRPVSLDIADLCLRRGMTEDERRLSYGLPFRVQKPPVNPNRRLNRAELRWIFLTEIRLDAIKSALAENNERAHRAYSVMARDFNARGANYEYELCEYRAAKRDIDAYKDAIAKNALTEAIVFGLTKP